MAPVESAGLLPGTPSTPIVAALGSIITLRNLSVTLMLALPYALSKIAIAGYTAYQELLFGEIGGAALEGEADSYHVLFLFMGTAMGGLRATSILSAPAFQTVPSRLEALGTREGGMARRLCAVLVALLRGLPVVEVDDDGDQLGRSTAPFTLNATAARTCEARQEGSDSDVVCHPTEEHADREALVIASSYSVVIYSIITSAVMKYFSATIIQSIAPSTGKSVLNVVAAFGDGFWWGSLPTLLLYNKEQLLLVSGHSLLPLMYGGVVYCTVGSLMAMSWVGDAAQHNNVSASTINDGVRSVGQSLAASAWVAYAALKLHLWLDPKLRAHSNPSLCTVIATWRCVRKHNSLSNAALVVVASLKQFLFIAAPLAVSNSMSLIRELVVAATTSECGSSAAQAYSISQAYYSTAEIALLAASSTISAVVASDKRFERPAIATVIMMSALLAVLPLIAPTAIAQFFGGSVYAYGHAGVDQVMSDVRYFNILSCVSFCCVAAGMSIAATLHGRRTVWRPLFIQLVCNGIGIGWAVVFWMEHQRSGVDCVWQSGGGVVTAVLSMVALMVLRWKVVADDKEGL